MIGIRIITKGNISITQIIPRGHTAEITLPPYTYYIFILLYKIKKISIIII